MNKIGVIGCGYVGLVCGAGLADFGNRVNCIDINKKRITDLKKGILPFEETGLKELIEANRKRGLLSFSDDIESGIRGCDAVVIAVQTPMTDNGSANMEFVKSVAGSLTRNLSKRTAIIMKSTVPIGTAKWLRELMNNDLAEKNADFRIDVISNPEFLREGSAVDTFLNPDRIVVGAVEAESFSLMESIYKEPVSRGINLIKCSNATAETIKYAANSFLALKISYINQMALLSEKTGADIKTVAEAVGSDKRISPMFLNPGPGYGGSCFPKDTRALVRTAGELGLDLSVIRSAFEANTTHKKLIAEKAITAMKKNGLDKLAVWGLSFKAGSGDMRNAPSLDILPMLAENGIRIYAYDPQAMEEASGLLKSNMIEFCESADKALEKSEALMILTEWEEFKEAGLGTISAGPGKSIIFDYRNIYDAAEARRLGFEYYGVGR